MEGYPRVRHRTKPPVSAAPASARNQSLEASDDVGYSITSKILVGLHERRRHRLNLLFEPSHNVANGAPLTRIGKALRPKVTHHSLQAKAKLAKFFAMLHAIILEIITNGSNLCFTGFHDLGFLLP
jgi:hypothetical protein